MGLTVVQAIETAGPGGAEQVLMRLSEGLGARGQVVCVVLLRDGWLRERLEERGMRVDLIPLADPFDRGFVRAFHAFLRQAGADVLHSRKFAFALYGRLAASAAARARAEFSVERMVSSCERLYAALGASA